MNSTFTWLIHLFFLTISQTLWVYKKYSNMFLILFYLQWCNISIWYIKKLSNTVIEHQYQTESSINSTFHWTSMEHEMSKSINVHLELYAHPSHLLHVNPQSYSKHCPNPIINISLLWWHCDLSKFILIVLI